jgi:hypothetical protein
MLSREYQEGVKAASKQFGVREASLLELLLGIGTPMAAKAGLNVLAPKLMPAVEKGLETPFKAVKGVGSSAMSALRGPQTPAELLAHQLQHAHLPSAPLEAPMAQHGMLAPVTRRGVPPR